MLIVGTVLACGVPVAAQAQHPDDPGLSGQQRVDALAARVEAAQKDLRTMEARFVQRRESELLVEPEERSGTFSFALPDRVRWEYDDPRPMTVVIRGEEMTTWYRDLNRAERANVGRYSDQVLRYLGAAGSLEKLRGYFDVRFTFPKSSVEPYQIDLSPRYERISKKLSAMTLWIDRKSFLPQRFSMIEPDGELTEFRFDEMRVNPEFEEGRFDLVLPPGVVVRTLTPDPSDGPDGS